MTLTPQEQEDLALALEEAARRVRQVCPEQAAYDARNDAQDIGDERRSVTGLRSPVLREFRIQW